MTAYPQEVARQTWRLVCFVICAGSIIGVLTFGAWGHSFYPFECCSDRDCAPLSAERVHSAPGGYLVDDKFFVAQKDARHSPDGDYHACFPKVGGMGCFWAPPAGS